MPVCALAPFYIQQHLQERNLDLGKLTRYEHHFSSKLAAASIQAATDRSPGGGLAGRVSWISAGFLVSYAPDARVAVALGAGLLIFAVAGLFDRRVTGVWLLAAAGSLVWFRTASYDFRNMMPFLPLWGLAAAAGIGVLVRASGRVHRLGPHPVRWAAAALAVVCAFPAARSAAGFGLRGIQPLEYRLGVMSRSPEERVRAFYPAVYPDFAFLRGLSLFRRADVLAPFELYRFLPRGIYPLRSYAWDVHPADVFAGFPQTLKLAPVEWTPARVAGSQVWVYEPAPKPVPAAEWATLRARDGVPDGAVAYDLLGKGRE